MKNKQPIILQLVDTLEAGGAERMSVTLANTLLENNISSFLCATRKGGILQKTIHKNVNTLILYKRNTFDIISIYRLKKFIQHNNINIIHAHSTSYFLAVIISFFTKSKVIWHDHNGNRTNTPFLKKLLIKLFSYKFNFVFTVNETLEMWGKENLHLPKQNIKYIPNFISFKNLTTSTISLPGSLTTRIVSVANLRFPKNHLFLLKAFNIIISKYPDWHLLLIGNYYNDTYNIKIKEFIHENNLSNNVHLLGPRSDIPSILKSSTIATLSSESEGLPMSLLEYARAKLPVVCTDVGHCREVLQNGRVGFLIQNNDLNNYVDKLELLINNKVLREKLGQSFYSHVSQTYSSTAIIQKIINTYKGIL